MALSFERLLPSTFLKNSSLAALPLRTKDVDIPYFIQNFLLALLAYMELAATHLTLTFISFCCIRIQFLSRILSLKALNERCSMNGRLSVCCQSLHRIQQISFLFFLQTDNCHENSPHPVFHICQRDFLTCHKTL